MKRFLYACLFLAAARSEVAWSSTDCATWLRHVAETSSYLVAMGGNASGSMLARHARALGFQTLHLRLAAVDATVEKSFPGSDVFARQWVFSDAADLPEIAVEINRFATASGRPLRGGSPGMDLGVYATDFVSAALGLEANSVEAGDWRTDKFAVHKALEKAKLPVVFTQHFSGPAELMQQANLLPYPLLVKPARGSGSVGAGTFFYPDSLRSGTQALIEENRRRRNPNSGLVVQEVLQPAGYIPFINTVSYRTRSGNVRRIVTGIWEDVRGEDFPKEIWDAIYMVPSEKYLSSEQLSFFRNIREADRKTLDALGAEVGVTHNEYMGHPLKLIDPNWRLPGLDSARLEFLATGMNPYHMEIASRVLPEVLDSYPDVYSFRTELQPALVFIRSHQDGTVTQEGFDWLSQQVERGARWLADCKFTGLTAPEHPVVIKRGGVQAHSRATTTRNGRTMVEWLQVVGRNRETVESFVRDVRQKERDGFFVRPTP